MITIQEKEGVRGGFLLKSQRGYHRNRPEDCAPPNKKGGGSFSIVKHSRQYRELKIFRKKNEKCPVFRMLSAEYSYIPIYMLRLMQIRK